MGLTEQEVAFTKLITEHKAAIYRICMANLNDTSYTDDLCQEVCMQIWKGLPSFRGEANIKTWIYRIAINCTISFNIKQNKTHYNNLNDSLLSIPDDNDSSIKEQQLKALLFCIQTLPPQDKLLISLYMEGLSYKEIAEVSGISISNTGVKISRIKNQLQIMITEKMNHHELG